MQNDCEENKEEVKDIFVLVVGRSMSVCTSTHSKFLCTDVTKKARLNGFVVLPIVEIVECATVTSIAKRVERRFATSEASKKTWSLGHVQGLFGGRRDSWYMFSMDSNNHHAWFRAPWQEHERRVI